MTRITEEPSGEVARLLAERDELHCFLEGSRLALYGWNTLRDFTAIDEYGGLTHFTTPLIEWIRRLKGMEAKA